MFVASVALHVVCVCTKVNTMTDARQRNLSARLLITEGRITSGVKQGSKLSAIPRPFSMNDD